jgi:hypothetical protein
MLIHLSDKMAVPRIGRSVADLSTGKPGFIPRPRYMGLTADTVAMKQAFSEHFSALQLFVGNSFQS